MSRSGPDPEGRNDIVLATDRLVLDAGVAEDADELFALAGGIERRTICQNLIWDGPEAVDDIAEWLGRNRTATWERWGFHWVIRDRTGELTGVEGTAMGSIGTRPLGQPGLADVGYWLGVPYWRQRVMSEALRAVLDCGFGRLNIHKIEAEVFAHNEAGRSLVESMGMTLEGVIRSSIRKYGEWVDAARYGLLWDEWGTRGSAVRVEGA